MVRSNRAMRIVLLVGLAALLVSGCSAARRAVVGVKEEAEAVVTKQSQQGKAPMPTAAAQAAAPTTRPKEAAQEEPAIDPAAATAFDRLASYRMVQVTRWRIEDKENPGESESQVEIAYVREPLRVEWRILENIEGESLEQMRMVWADGVLYTGSGDEWMAIESDEDMYEPWTVTPDRYISSSSKRVGTETINGMRTVHYRQEGQSAALAGLGELAQADYWLSEEHKIIVRSIVVWTGKEEDGRQARYEMQWDITDINTPIEIVVPEGVAKPGLPDDVPLFAGAREVQSMTGFTSFEVDAPAQKVLEFYLGALADSGWSAEEGFGPMATFAKDGRTLTLVVDDSSAPTRVTIMVNED